MDVIDHLPDPVEGLTVGFGLECLDDLVREAAINKGFGTRSIRKAVRAIDRVNSAQQEVRVAFEIYVLLKPLFLSEQEGIDEALRTIQWAYAQGAESVSLFMNTVKPRTVQGYLASRRDLPPPVRYEPPFYRSAIQVLRQLPPEQRRLTKVLGMQSGIVATELPRGCALCTPFLSGSLSAHNFIGDPTILDLAAGSWCPCKRQWLDSLAIPVESVPSRISAGLNVLESFLK
ncbi:MAG: hypothetical protein M1389_14395 [Chloroflexi bacterium]|nr:hypothetical protein [Chloroflexota bacterium]